MAVDSYANLKSALSDYLARSDLDTFRDDFIDRAEAYFNRYFMRCGPPYQMEEETTLTTDSSGNATLPSDILGIRSARFSSSPNTELIPVSMGGENRLSPYDTASSPAHWFSVSGTTFRITPIVDAASVVLTYYEKVPALDATTTTNWLLDLAPDAYFYRALAEGFTFSRKFDVAAGFAGVADRALGEVCTVSTQTRYHNAEIVFTGVAP